MSALLRRPLTLTQAASSDLSGLVRSCMRWFSLAKRPVGKPSLQLLESVALSADTSIALVRFERHALVLGVTPQNVRVLFRRELTVTAAETPAPTGAPVP